MKVLLTGARGFLGQYVLRNLIDSGIDTVTLGRKKVDLLSQTDFNSLLGEIGATHLLHLAWYTEHGTYWTSPLNIRWAESSVRLVEAFCRAGGKKVVLAGTCAEYDWAHGYCNEDLTPLKPNTLYGVAKDATRRLAEAVCSVHQVDLAWARIFLPYGHGEDSRRLLPSLMDAFQGKRDPFGVNANAYRDFLHADDVAAGFVKLLQTGAVGAYNICSGQPVRLADVVRQVAQAYGADPQIVLALSTERTGEPAFLVGCNQKLRALGWRARHLLVDVPKSFELS